MKKLGIVLALATLTPALFAIQGTVSTELDSKTGEIKWLPRQKIYTISYKKGKTVVDGEYKLADVTSLEIAKPANFDKLVQMVEAGQGASAIAVAQKVVDEDRSASYTGSLAPAYWRALFKNGRTDQLEKLLAKAASSGDRAASADALVMRGDIIMANGQEAPDAARKALSEAYLRVVLMYTDDACILARKAAIAKAAGALDKLGYASRAETLRAQLQNLK